MGEKKASLRFFQIGSLVLVSLAVTWIFGPPALKGYQSRNWPLVEAAVMEVKLVQGSGVKPYLTSTRAVVTYLYAIDGQRNRGDRTAFSVLDLNTHEINEQLHEGSVVQVAVNPADARESVLQPGFSFVDLSVILLSWLLTIVGILYK